MVLSVQAKKDDRTGKYEAYYDIGRENSGMEVVDWCRQAVALGAGEILLTSIDKEGTRKGFDTELIKKVSEAVHVPVIASGGFGKNHDVVDAMQAGANAVAIAYGLHYGISEISEIKLAAKTAGIEMR